MLALMAGNGPSGRAARPWPSYGSGKVNEIALPHWAYNKLDEYAENELNAE